MHGIARLPSLTLKASSSGAQAATKLPTASNLVSVVGNRLLSHTNVRCLNIGLRGYREICIPSQSFRGGRFRLVFATTPAAVSDLVEMTEQKRIVDLTGARFVAAGTVGQLHMGDMRQALLQCR